MLNTKIISKSIQESYFNATDPSLTCWLDFNKETGTLDDLSPVGNNDGTIVGTGRTSHEALGNVSYFVGNPNYVQISPDATLKNLVASGSFALSIWVKPQAIGVQAIVAQGNGTGTGRSWLTFFEPNGLDPADIASFLGGSALHSDIAPTLGQWYHVVVNYLERDPAEAFGRLQLYVNNVLTANEIRDVDEAATGDIYLTVSKFINQGSAAYIHEMTIWNRGLLRPEIDALYNKGVIQFQGGPGAVETKTLTSGPIGGTPMKVISGSHKMSAELINGSLAKMFESVTDGRVATEIDNLNMSSTEAAYGTWEWAAKKNGSGALSIAPIAVTNAALDDAGQSGYVVEIASNGTLSLGRIDSGVTTFLFTTNPGYLSDDVLYRFKPTRDPQGKFTLYISGGSFGEEWTAVSTNTGTNPVIDTTYTASNHVLFDIDAGDKVIWGAEDDRFSFTKNLIVK